MGGSCSWRITKRFWEESFRPVTDSPFFSLSPFKVFVAIPFTSGIPSFCGHAATTSTCGDSEGDQQGIFAQFAVDWRTARVERHLRRGGPAHMLILLLRAIQVMPVSRQPVFEILDTRKVDEAFSDSLKGRVM
jgi:hypothetical protein